MQNVVFVLFIGIYVIQSVICVIPIGTVVTIQPFGIQPFSNSTINHSIISYCTANRD